jgi:hypothetical protein
VGANDQLEGPRWANGPTTGQEAFDRRLEEFIRDFIEAKIAEIIAQENTGQYYHGSSFSHQREDGSTQTGPFEESRSEAAVRHEDIVNFRLASLPEFISQMAGGFFGAMMTRMYEVVGEAAESVGNVVDGRDKSLAEAFLESLRQVEFGVDRDGHVTRPQIHMHPSLATRMRDELESQGPEFHEEVARLQAEKTEAALEKERIRLSRFKVRS